MNQPLLHTTVLLDEAVSALLAGQPPQPAGLWIDATFGRGGHSRHLLQRLGPQAQLLAFDKDPEAIAEAATLADPRFAIRHEGFCHLADLPAGSADGILMDLGISSPQIDAPERGFSFRFDGPLDMRMDPTRGHSVADWLASAEAPAIAEVVREYGEERFAGPIARAIVARRTQQGPLTRTAQLADLVASVVKTREAGQHPATRTFQALRIAVNEELSELVEALAAAERALRPGGRLVVVTFHSLEDRIVKTFLSHRAKAPSASRHQPQAEGPEPSFRLVAKGAVEPGPDEVAGNPRSRSAKLRAAERTDAPAHPGGDLMGLLPPPSPQRHGRRR